MIATAWLLAFLGFPVAAGLLLVWWVARRVLLCQQRRVRWEQRRLDWEAYRRHSEAEYEARVLRRVARADELADIRAEILAGENETPLQLVKA